MGKALLVSFVVEKHTVLGELAPNDVSDYLAAF
jgi:hypothetical protein